VSSFLKNKPAAVCYTPSPSSFHSTYWWHSVGRSLDL